LSLDPNHWLVLAGSAAAIAWVNWYFFLAQRRGVGLRATSPPGGIQEVTITVKGGYDPATIRAKVGRPLRLVFDRRETSGCSEEVVLPDFGVRRFLPPFQKTMIEIVPSKAGRYQFMCGMSMLRGTLIAEE
jgi:plastocyanin domain-containing protein